MRLGYLVSFMSAVLFAGSAGADIVPPWFKAEALRFEFVDSGQVHITNAVAYFHHGETVISGNATLSTRDRTTVFSGLMRASVAPPNGKKAELGPVPIHTRNRPRVYGRTGFFTLHVGYRLPPDTVVRLTYR